ncbi:MAG: hypothetical protein PHW62_00645 [Candidatus Ratteibacteria bacterium]|nr:hypothetical protein [Candidatus Ratteibacteria bacterium]
MAKIHGWRKVKHLQIISDIPYAQHQWVNEMTGRHITIYPLTGSNNKFVVTPISGIESYGMTKAIQVARDWMRTHQRGRN